MKINVNGKEIEVDQVWPARESEPWNEYELENGDRIRMKTVAKKILKVRVTDHQYIVQSSNIVDVDNAPEAGE